MQNVIDKLRSVLGRILKIPKKNGLPDLSELPDNFYVGQEYIEDPNKIPVLVEVFFYSTAVLDKAEINALGKKMVLEQKGALLRFAFVDKISKKLFENIRDKHHGDDWILGYVVEVMPFVNQEILKQRHESAHLLAKTFSMLDIYRLLISKLGDKKRIEVHWPRAITAFPPVTELARKYDHVHLRDLIDAIHSFFNNNFDDCIRRLITSVENAFDFYKLRRIKKDSNSEFEDIIKQNIDIKCTAINKNIADEIIEAYRIRNKIVHEGYRIPPTEKTLCRHLIHMVLDFYKFYGADEDLKKFCFFIEMQWQSLENFIGSGLTLQKLEIYEKMKNMENQKLNCVIIHGCPSDAEKAMDPEGRTYDKHWIPWIKKNLVALGIETETPLMPNPWAPVYEDFRKEFEKYPVSENTILIGHSCGCAFLVRWLGESKQKIKKLILVAPWKIVDEEDRFRPAFYNYPIDKTIKDRVDEIVMFTADDEEEVGKESLRLFYEALGGKIIELKGRGHYTLGDMGTEEFPELLEVAKT